MRVLAVIASAMLLAVTGCSGGLDTVPAGPPPNALPQSVACAQIRDEYERFSIIAADVLTSTTRTLPKLAFINARDSAAANLKVIASSGTSDANVSADELAQGIALTGIAGDAGESRAQMARGALLYRSACGTYLTP